MKKKILATILSLTLAVGLAACGDAQKASGKDALTPIKVAASTTPHAEILEQAKEALKEKGYDLQITEFADYVQPNNVVESGEFDANYFQHVLYLGSFNEEHGTHLVNAGSIHYEPFGIYAGKQDSLENVPEGGSIAVPNDTTNEARALLLLQENGLITLKDGVGLEATKLDIVENPKNLEIVELEAAQISLLRDDFDYVVLNGNYALQAGLSVAKDALAAENSESEVIQQNYVNVIAVKEGNEGNEAIKALVEVLKSDELASYINESYDGAVVPFVEQ